MFRFTIRDLLWLTVVVALATAWWLDHRTVTHDLLNQKQSAEAWLSSYRMAAGILDQVDPHWRKKEWIVDIEYLQTGRYSQPSPSQTQSSATPNRP